MRPLSAASRSLLRVLLASLTLGATGCFAIADVDRFETDPSTLPTGTGPYRDLRFELLNASFHGDQLFEVRVVSDENVLLASAVLDPPGVAGGAPIAVHLPQAVPRSGNARLEFYADVNGSRSFDGIGAAKDKRDHAWRVGPLREENAAYVRAEGDTLVVAYAHDSNFTDIGVRPDGSTEPLIGGLDANVNVLGLDAYAGKLVEARMVESATGRVTGLYRLPKAPSTGVASMPMRGVLDEGIGYDLELYVDASGDGTFQPTGRPASEAGDAGWRGSFVPDATGASITIDVAVAAQATDITHVY